MYPNNNQPIPSDYLNQIAPPPAKKASFIRNQPILVGAICLAVVLILMMTIGSLSSSNTKPSQQLAARLIATKEVADDATDKIKDSDLRAINSNLNIILTNAVRDIAEPLSIEKITIKKIDKKITLAESNKTLMATLEDARLNARYDRIYAQEMAYKLDTILTLMDQINSTTKSKSLKSFLITNIDNIKPVQKQFADFNSTSD